MNRIPRKYLTGLIACLFFPLAQNAYSREEPGDLNTEECRKLYEHQLFVASTDSHFVLQPATKSSLDSMKSEPSPSLQMKACQSRISRKNFDCQMKSSSMLEILQCDLRFGTDWQNQRTDPETAGGSDGKSSPGIGSDPEGGSADQGNESLNGQTIIEETVQLQTTPVPITGKNCNRGYEHLLSVYANHPRLSESSRRQEILAYWKSTEARDSFHEKCMSRFQERDLGCILQTRDTDVIRGCLAQIPD